MSGSMNPPPPPSHPEGPPVPEGAAPAPPRPARPQGRPGSRLFIFALLGCGGVMAVMFAGLIAFLVWFDYAAPDTAIIHGPQVPQRFMTTIRETGVLEADEEVLFFYSDAFMDITRGFYLLTDRKVVLYSTDWAEPAILLAFDEIAELDVEYNKSFFEDSMIYLELTDGSFVSLPASSDYDRDELFFEALEQKWLEATGAAESGL